MHCLHCIIIFPTLVSHCQKKEPNCSPKTNEGLGTLQECKCPQILLITFEKTDGTNKVTSASAGVNIGCAPSGRGRVFGSFIEHFLTRDRHREMLRILFPSSASCSARRNSLCTTTSCSWPYQDGQTCAVSFNHRLSKSIRGTQNRCSINISDMLRSYSTVTRIQNQFRESLACEGTRRRGVNFAYKVRQRSEACSCEEADVGVKHAHESWHYVRIMPPIFFFYPSGCSL